MNRRGERREHDAEPRQKMRRRNPELEEAYECGCEDGYNQAMKEIKYGERMRRY